MSDERKYVLRSDELSFTLISTPSWVNVWRTLKEPYNPKDLVPTVKHEGGSVTIWAKIYCYSAGPIITLSDRITASDYTGFYLTGRILSMFYPNNDAILQDDSSLMRPAGWVSLYLRGMKMHFNIFSGQHSRQTSISSNRCGQFRD